MKKIWKREEIPVEHTWATEDLYASDEAWEAELATVEADKDALVAYAGRLAESGETLCAYLTLMEKVDEKLSLLANYCMRKSDEDTRNATYQAMQGKFMSVFVDLGAATSFDTPEIMAISEEDMERFYRENPVLERYRRYLTNLRRMKEHTLSPAEEKLLAAAGEMAQAPDTIYGFLADADLTFESANLSDPDFSLEKAFTTRIPENVSLIIAFNFLDVTKRRL